MDECGTQSKYNYFSLLKENSLRILAIHKACQHHGEENTIEGLHQGGFD